MMDRETFEATRALLACHGYQLLHPPYTHESCPGGTCMATEIRVYFSKEILMGHDVDTIGVITFLRGQCMQTHVPLESDVIDLIERRDFETLQKAMLLT